MKLMTCCSCDRPPGPRLHSAAAGAEGACGSAAGQTQRRRDGVYFGRWFGAGHPVCSPTNLNTPPPSSSHALNANHRQHTHTGALLPKMMTVLLTHILLEDQFAQSSKNNNNNKTRKVFDKKDQMHNDKGKKRFVCN